IMSCRFISAYRTRDYSQIFILSLLLMVVAAMTSGGIILAPFFVIFTLLAGYSVMLYQLQRQIEIVTATRFVGRVPTAEEYRSAINAARTYWRQLGHIRFHFSAGIILFVALALALAVFFGFPRLETGSLLGSKLSDASVSGFSEMVRFGQIDRNQTLRQIIARVSFHQNGTLLTGQDGPFYLRGVTLDRFRSGDEYTEDDVWVRSFPVYLTNERKTCTSIQDSPDVITQQILLSGYQSNLMPGLYPIVAIDGLPENSYNYCDLDSTASSLSIHPRPTWEYRAASLAIISPEQAKERFNRHVRQLGQFWPLYSRNKVSLSATVDKLAYEIVGDLAEERQQLQNLVDQAFLQWLHIAAGITATNFAYDETPFILPGTWGYKYAPPDEYELELLDNLYEANAELSRIDQTIMQRIISWLQNNYRYCASPPPITPDESEEENDDEDYFHPIIEFLKNPGVGKAGNCEYFASAATMLARSLGLRVRLAGGYLTWEYIPENEYFIVRQSDAHVWTELYTVTNDWITYDPTPTIPLQIESSSPGGIKAWMTRLSARLEQWQVRWLRYTASHQEDTDLYWADAVSQWIASLESDRDKSPGRIRQGLLTWFTHNSDESYFALFLRWMIFFLAIVDIGIGVRELLLWLIPKYTRWRAYRRYLCCYDDNTIAFYPQMLQMLQHLHLHKPAAMTPREFAIRVMHYDEEAFAPVGQLSEAYYRVRFGRLPLDETRRQFIDDALQRLGIVIKSICNTVKRPWPWEHKSDL
ncbi:MAG: transglutaminase domain-containing protein, partial [Sedimentisphaerales bacterium]|nr:transglutaminase domain-containing protein [Sedimentisphaerales bacterium]